MWKYIALFALVSSVKCGPVQDGVAENVMGAVSECIDNDTSICLKEKALKYTERLALTKDVSLFDGMNLVNTGSARSARSYEPLAEDPKTREMQLEERIANNIGDFLDNHVLQLRLTEKSDGESRDLDEEARGKKKKKIKQLLPILLLLKLKLAALIPLFLGIIAFVAVKAVFLGKIAFAMNAVSLIRKLLAKNGSGGGGSIGYNQHHHDEHPGYNYEPAQGWSRQAADAQSLAYGGQL
ncbi:hypothetical protein ACJJTC_014115 [Scirpophaga incertulas]